MMQPGKGLLARLLVLSAAVPALADDVKVDSDTFGGMEARALGPAAMSGRIAAVDAVPGERLTIYVGAASGGVWKSVDGGLQFKPLFDKMSTQSIGAIRVDPKDAKTIWVGTGESWTRNSVSVGDGVYKSTDGGESWSRMGLATSERIARIVVDPKSSDTVFVCATGHLFDDHKERGVYRTKDAGKTWEKVLFVAEDTGCGDLAIDPQDGRILYAGMWQARRKPYFFNSGGPKSGLYKSSDGGSTWRRITKGLPEGDLGRIALTVSTVRPSLVFATVESKKTGFYRSDDLGESWSLQNTSSAVSGRPFYFSNMVADPKNLDRVYKTTYNLHVSDDAGKTWSGLGGNYHGDTHALWIHPQQTDQLLMGTDGGLYESLDRGAHWRFIATLPVSQFYHVSYDMQLPYNVYGGLQDNNTWTGPSRKPGGIGNKHWNALLGGDGFWVFPDPSDEDLVYAEYQGGNLFKVRKTTGEAKDIKPSPKQGEPKYRFNWNSPIQLSEQQPGTLYFGSQFLFRSKDRGESWERISPDLTTNDPEKQKQKESGGLTRDNSTAENHCTIFTISESPLDANVVWAGSDDGNLQVTKDGGKTWTNVAASVGVPKATWVSRVEAGRFDPGTAYASFDGHMTGDMKTYVYRTTDFGKTWQSLATDDLKGYAHVVKEDREDKDLLFVGTESGLFASVDGGKQWGQFTAGLPSVAVRDLVIHPREGDLVIATHGRGIYILDDLTPLRGLSPQVLGSDAAFLPSRPAQLLIPNSGGSDWSGDDQYEGRSVGEVAYITYYLKKRHIVGDLRVEVYDPSGKLLSTLPGGKRRGLNRVEWAMRQPAPRFPAGAGIIPSAGAFFGPRAPEGTYAVKLIKGKESFTSELKLLPDPRVHYSDEDKKLQQETTWKLYALVEKLTFLVDSITGLRDQAKARAGKLPAGDALRKRLEALAETLESQRKALVATQEGEGISGEEKLREELGMLYGNVNFHDGRPTGSQLNRMGVLAKDLEAARATFEAQVGALDAVNPQLKARKLDPVTTMTEAEWRKPSGS